MEKIFFVNKNWPNDPNIGCKSSSSLVYLIETNVDLEEELEELERTFERDEIMEFLYLN